MSRAAILRRVIKSVEAAIERDRDHRVRVTRDYCAGEFDALVFGRPVPDWRCDDFSIRGRALWIRATGDREPICDGASLCPDRVGKLDLAWGYIPHDLLYAHMAEMARDPAWAEAGWTEPEIRRLADMVLARGVEHAGEVVGGAWRGVSGLVARIMHGAVRLFGGLYHRIALLLALAALCCALCGCAGCAIPGGFTPSDTPPPYTVEKVQ